MCYYVFRNWKSCASYLIIIQLQYERDKNLKIPGCFSQPFHFAEEGTTWPESWNNLPNLPATGGKARSNSLSTTHIFVLFVVLMACVIYVLAWKTLVTEANRVSAYCMSSRVTSSVPQKNVNGWLLKDTEALLGSFWCGDSYYCCISITFFTFGTVTEWEWVSILPRSVSGLQL